MVDRLGLADRVTILDQDYRDLEGSYDKLVSVEMIEAVGHQYYPAFFANCARLLKPNGIAVLQAITIADQTFEAAKHRVDFIKKFIFPGSRIPQSLLCVAATTYSDCACSISVTTRHTMPIPWSYGVIAREHEASIRELGFDDRFLRLWNSHSLTAPAALLSGRFRWSTSVG